MKSRSLHNSTKKGFMIFFTVTLRPFIKCHSPPPPSPPPCFPSRNITKKAKTHPHPRRDVNIGKPHISGNETFLYFLKKIFYIFVNGTFISSLKPKNFRK